MKGFGFIVLMASIALGAYALFFFDPSISTAYGKIVNMGKLQDRQNLLIVAAVGSGIGTLVMLFARPGEKSPQTKFATSIASGDLVVMEQMLSSGVIDPNGRAPGGFPCWLKFAVDRKAVRPCALLLRKGANPELPDGFGTSVIHYMSQQVSNSPALDEIRALFANPPALDERPQETAAPNTPIGSQPSQRGSLVEELAELARLKESGFLTTAEFEAAKARVLVG